MLVLLDIVPYNPYLVLIECAIAALMILGYGAYRLHQALAYHVPYGKPIRYYALAFADEIYLRIVIIRALIKQRRAKK